MSKPSPFPLANVKCKLLTNDAKMPTYGSAEAAGADLYAVNKADGEIHAIYPGDRAMVSTGLAIELPVGFEAQIRPRSGLAAKHGITVLNTPGTIDSDYRGEIKVILFNSSDRTYYVNSGDRIAQMVIAPVTRGDFKQVDELGDTDRGAGGFGSTGTN